jgi:tetratricopeptide (TPR) repeat protein
MRRAAALAIGLAAIGLVDRPAVAADWARCADGNVDACTTIIRSRKTSDEDRAAAYYNRGNAYLAQSRHDLAIGDYDAAIRLKPDYVEAYNNRGIAYYGQRLYDRAIADYDAAIRLRPDLAEAFNNRCLAYLRKGQFDLATRDFDQTIRLNKNYGNALINRALGSSGAPNR